MEETETQDFMMNIESFSLIRRPSSKNKNPKHIRLFGKSFTGQEPYSNSSDTKNKPEEEDEEDEEEDEESQIGDNVKDNSIRRFECHYCYRNFSTSQALGGHQNAHKRERQLAKRGSSSNFFHYPSWTTAQFPAIRSYGGGGVVSGYYTRTINRRIWRLPSSSFSVQGVYNSNATFNTHDNYSNSAQPQPPLQVGGSEADQNRILYGLSPNVQDLSLDLHL